jgi:hypothetical protein
MMLTENVPLLFSCGIRQSLYTAGYVMSTKHANEKVMIQQERRSNHHKKSVTLGG